MSRPMQRSCRSSCVLLLFTLASLVAFTVRVRAEDGPDIGPISAEDSGPALFQARLAGPHAVQASEPPLVDPLGNPLASRDDIPDDFSSKDATQAPRESTDQPSSTDPTVPPVKLAAPDPLTPELAALKEKLRRVLLTYYPKHQTTNGNTPWEVMHAIIAYGVDTQLFKNVRGGDRVNAVGWMCYNHPCGGDQILFVSNGKIEARRGVGVQGHAGQFLAILAQSHVKRDYPMYVSGKYFTLNDLIEREKETCVAGEELTFKLISLMHYLDSDETWNTRDGQTWSIQRLIKEELKQKINGAACGGTHRLMGFSYAVNKRTQRGKPLVGEFVRAKDFIQGYHRYTFSLQNPDGSFSTEWFVRRGNDPDIDRRLKTSGHILEWIAFSLSDTELQDPRMIKAVDYVATILERNDRHNWEIGPLGHGLHALAIYQNRMFGPLDFRAQSNFIVEQPDQPEALEAKRVEGSLD